MSWHAKDRRARLHALVTVTAWRGHPLLDCFRQGGVQEGGRRRLAFRTKPQYARQERGSENVVTPLRIGTPSNLGAAPREPRTTAGALSPVRRANAGYPVPTAPSRRGLGRSGEKPALPLYQNDPNFSYIVRPAFLAPSGRMPSLAVPVFRSRRTSKAGWRLLWPDGRNSTAPSVRRR